MTMAFAATAAIAASLIIGAGLSVWQAVRATAAERDQRELRVTAERVRAWIDGEPVVDASIAGRKVSLRTEVVPSRPLGVSSYATVARLRSVRLRRLAPGS